MLQSEAVSPTRRGDDSAISAACTCNQRSAAPRPSWPLTLSAAPTSRVTTAARPLGAVPALPRAPSCACRHSTNSRRMCARPDRRRCNCLAPWARTDAARAVIAAPAVRDPPDTYCALPTRAHDGRTHHTPNATRPIVEPMLRPTPHESQPGGTKASEEHVRIEGGYAQLAAVFNTDAANADRRAARDIYAGRCEP